MQYINLHTHHKSTEVDVISIQNLYPEDHIENHLFSVGIHPWYIDAKSDAQFSILQEKATHKNCYAIGECGLDKVTSTNFALQETVFKQQIQLAEKLQKPLIIHCVKAYQEIFNIKKALLPQQTWILHGFNKNEQLAKQMLSVGYKLSFGAALLENSNLQRTFAHIDNKDFFLETDNTEVSIKEVYQKAAEVRDCTVQKLQQQIMSNFKEVFKK